MGIDSLGSQYINSLAFTDTAADKARQAAGRDYSEASDKELLDVCKKFEAYFIEQVLKEVKKTVPDTMLGSGAGSNLVDFFMDETLQKVSENIQDNAGLGLAQQMYEQMKRNYSIPEAPTDNKAEEALDAETEASAEEDGGITV